MTEADLLHRLQDCVDDGKLLGLRNTDLQRFLRWIESSTQLPCRNLDQLCDFAVLESHGIVTELPGRELVDQEVLECKFGFSLAGSLTASLMGFLRQDRGVTFAHTNLDLGR